MSRQSISLKARVRYEGRVRTFDRRAATDLEKVPDPLRRLVGQVLRAKFGHAAGSKNGGVASGSTPTV